MKTSFVLSLGTALGVTSASLFGRVDDAACKKDTCGSAITGANRLNDCSSFFDYTVVRTAPTKTTTVTPTARTTVYDVTVTQTYYDTYTSVSVWPTTINTELYSPYNKRAVASCAVVSTASPTNIPDYARSSSCSNTALYSSACSCAGVKRSTTTQACSTPVATATASPHTTITDHATYTAAIYKQPGTASFTTALVDKIRCGSLWQYVNDQPAFKTVCEAQGPSDQSVISTVKGTDWDNCCYHAYWDIAAYAWSFDLDSQTCYVYSADFPGYNVTTPKARNVYAYIV